VAEACQPDALSPPEATPRSVKRKVIQSHIYHELQRARISKTGGQWSVGGVNAPGLVSGLGALFFVSLSLLAVAVPRSPPPMTAP
jgi:hypothetical protein